eukprot:6106339-Pleurochrysis_carterae.AAC.1
MAGRVRVEAAADVQTLLCVHGAQTLRASRAQIARACAACARSPQFRALGERVCAMAAAAASGRGGVWR